MMKANVRSVSLKVADEVWIAAAQLHRENPERLDFSVEEITRRAAKESEGEMQRPGVYVHVVQHCVANRRPNPGRYRMLYETAPGRRRLFRPGDPYDPAREGAKITPHADDLPDEYQKLLHWYNGWSAAANARALSEDPLLALVGSGKHLWGDEHPDEYVRKVREGWE
jgi:hypothetical protein